MRLPTKAEWLSAGSWIKNHAPAFTAATISLTALWFAVILACITLYVWDSTFYRAQAPEGMELTFWTAGIVFRTVVIFGLVAIVWAKASKAPAGWVKTLRVLWCMGLVACFIAALGFITEGLDFRERRVGAVTGVETVSIDAADSQIEELKAQKTAIEQSRDKIISDLQVSINNITSDRLDNDDLADAYRIDQSKERDSARTKIDAIDAKIISLMDKKQDSQLAATEKSTHETAIPTVFRFMAFNDDGVSRIIRNVFALFWTALIELVGGLGAGALYGLHRHAQSRASLLDAASKGGRTTQRRRRVSEKQKLIEDYSKEKQQTEADLSEEVEPIEEEDLSEDTEEDDDERDDGLAGRTPQAAE